MSERTDVLRDVLWVEKYRPTKLEDLALDGPQRSVLESYLAAGEIPHLLLVGPPGVGKTTIARIIYRALDCRHLTLNASAERGIDTIREKVGNFVTSAAGVRWNIPFLDEADNITADGQMSLRNLMETYAERSRFILTANKLHRIISPIQSRCQIITLGSPPLKERYRILSAVLAAEGIKADAKIALGYAERYTDLRQMLMGTQRAYLAAGELPPVASDTTLDGKAMLEYLETKNWTLLKRLCTGDGFDPSQALRELFWAVPDDHRRVAFLRYVLGKGVHESGFTPDPIILFLGTCAEAMEGL